MSSTWVLSMLMTKPRDHDRDASRGLIIILTARWICRWPQSPAAKAASALGQRERIARLCFGLRASDLH